MYSCYSWDKIVGCSGRNEVSVTLNDEYALPVPLIEEALDDPLRPISHNPTKVNGIQIAQSAGAVVLLSHPADHIPSQPNQN